jgi:hypothetical protein
VAIDRLEDRTALSTDLTLPAFFVPTGDFNGDGARDSLSVDLDGNVTVITPLNAPNPRILDFGRIPILAVQRAWGKFPAQGMTSLMEAADFNDDGRDDLLIKAWNGQLLIAESTGSGFTMKSFGVLNEQVAWADPRVGDFNGDGELDIVIRERVNGRWWLFAGDDGELDEVRVFGQWNPNANWRYISHGDFDGDGTHDLVGFTDRAQWWVSFGQDDEDPFQSRLFAQWNPNAYWYHDGYFERNGFRIQDVNGDGRDDVIGFEMPVFAMPAPHDGGGATTVVHTTTTNNNGIDPATQPMMSPANPASSNVRITIGLPDGVTPPPAPAWPTLRAWVGRSTGSSFVAERTPSLDEETVIFLPAA